MVLPESQRLEQTARKVAFGRVRARADLRQAVCQLALTAFRSRVLTLPHVASVVSAIEHGIDPARAGARTDLPAARALALEGLRQALSRALTALDLAAREYASVGGRLAGNEVDEWLRALDAMPEIDGGEIEARIAAIRKTLQAAESEEAAEGTYVLGLLASGVLLGLQEGVVSTAAPSKAPARRS
jgi:hypothetical protein